MTEQEAREIAEAHFENLDIKVGKMIEETESWFYFSCESPSGRPPGIRVLKKEKVGMPAPA